MSAEPPALAPAKPAELAAAAASQGFADGARAFGHGFKFIVLRPASWPLAIVPMVVALVLIALVAAGAEGLAMHLGAELRRGAHGVGLVLAWLGSVAMALAALLVSVLVGFSLAQPLSGFALDNISRQVETGLGGEPRPDGSFWETAWRGLRVTFAALLIGVPILGLLTLVSVVFSPAVVVTVPLKFIVSALLIAWDFLDYPLGLRGMRVRERLRWCRANLRGVLTFGLLCGAVLLVPGLGLVALPIGVAGATRLVVASERALPSKP